MNPVHPFVKRLASEAVETSQIHITRIITTAGRQGRAGQGGAGRGRSNERQAAGQAGRRGSQLAGLRCKDAQTAPIAAASKAAAGSRRRRDLRVSTSQVTQTLQWKGLRKNLQPTDKGEALTAPSTWGAYCPASHAQHSSRPERTAAACCAANAAAAVRCACCGHGCGFSGWQGSGEN